MTKAKSTSAAQAVNEIATLRAEILDSKPLIWRELEVPTSLTLLTLHHVLQVAFLWADYHLWQFEVDGRAYGPQADPDMDVKDASKVRLRDIFGGGGTTTLSYLYDFGDNWELRLQLSKVQTGLPEILYPRLVGGKMAAPPEDCGGLPGYYYLLEARDKANDPDHAEALEILDEWDPESLKADLVEIGLNRIARQRNGARARVSTSNNDKD